MPSTADLPRAKLLQQVWQEGRLEENLAAVYGDPAEGDPVEPDVALGLAGNPGAAYTKSAVARAAGRISRAAGRGGGTTAPGRLLLRLAPGALPALAGRLSGGVTLVSATNGKTTTARMLASILEADGRAVVHNRAGANTHWGIATALAEQDGDTGVFEVDEAWLGLMTVVLRPDLVVLGNLSRDRLDGYGELDRLVWLWQRVLGGAHAPSLVVANADDPLLAGPGGVLAGTSQSRILFGIEDEHAGSPRPGHPHEAYCCRGCERPLSYERAYVGHLGSYRCDGCGHSRPAPAVSATRVEERDLRSTHVTVATPGGRIAVELSQPGLHNVHNALAATAAAVAMGVAADTIRRGLAAARPPFGRSETLTVRGRSVHVCLIKNPAGVNATLQMLGAHHDRARDAGRLHLWLALNDDWADGRDVSWIWDADFERLSDRVEAVTCSGRRAHELALRLKYAGWSGPIDVDEDLDASFERALAGTPRALIALPTYTALLEMRALLNRRGLEVSDWGTTARLSA